MKSGNVKILMLKVVIIGAWMLLNRCFASDTNYPRSPSTVELSFQSPFPQTPFKTVHAMSKQVWGDIVLFKSYQDHCTQERPVSCSYESLYLDKIVDHALAFHHAVSTVQQSPPIGDDIEYLCGVIDLIQSDVAHIKSTQALPEYSCLQVVLRKTKQSLEKFIS